MIGNRLTIAVPKGRLAEECMEILLQKKWVSQKTETDGRVLIYNDPVYPTRLLFVRAQDVPVYVMESAADAGLAGLDLLSEGEFGLFSPVSMNIGLCRLSVAAKPGFTLKKGPRKVRVATKYPKLTKSYFYSRGISCEIVKLYGSIELAPLCGMSDCIVDLVSTGNTLRANNLQEIEVILHSNARLVFGRSALYTNRDLAVKLIRDLS